MSVITIAKVTQLPAQYTPNTMYLVRNSAGTFYESFFSTSDGADVVPGVNENFVVNRIAELASNGFSELFVVNTIMDRDQLVLERNSMVYVIDASGDGFGSVGEVLYLFHIETSAYHRITGVYQLVQWGSVLGRPESSTEAIDLAVAAAHTHANKAILDKITVNANGELVFDGKHVLNVSFVECEW